MILMWGIVIYILYFFPVYNVKVQCDFTTLMYQRPKQNSNMKEHIYATLNLTESMRDRESLQEQKSITSPL